MIDDAMHDIIYIRKGNGRVASIISQKQKMLQSYCKHELIQFCSRFSKKLKCI